MRTANPDMGSAAESVCNVDGVKSDSKLANLEDIYNLFGHPSLGEPYQNAKAMVAILENMQSGMTAYHEVFEALQSKYGNDFEYEFFKELHR